MNPYDVLGVAHDATPDQIKSAYRKLAMKHHPDQHGGSEESTVKFQEIQSAYDMLRTDKPQQSNHSGDSQPGGWSFHYNGSDPSKIFEEMFRRHQEAHMNATTTYQAFTEITLEEALTGCEREFNLPNGKTIKIVIPAGIDHGQGFVVPDAVEATKQMPKGHLQIIVRLQRHHTFGRQGPNLITKVEVDLLDAILGCEKEIETLSGSKIRIKLAPNSQPNSIITVSREGMSILNSDGERGDLLVHLMVLFREFSETERKILEQLR